MPTVTNQLNTHIFIPDEAGKRGGFRLPPRGTITVPALTGPLKNAEKNGLVSFDGAEQKKRPAPVRSTAAKRAARKVEPAPEPPAPEPPSDTEEDLTTRIMAMVQEGKSQRAIGEELGIGRNEVYNLIRKHRAAEAKKD